MMRTWMRYSFGKLAGTLGAVALGVAVPDAAYACKAVIGDFVWHDLNSNGVQDSGEPGIAGVQVNLSLPDGTVLQSVWTDANGYYSFSTGKDALGNRTPPLCDTPYQVSVVTPAGYLPTSLGAGDTTTDSNDHTGALVIVSETAPPYDAIAEDLTIDFGFVTPPVVCAAAVGNFVWNDANNNGVQDAGEAGIPGNVVSLTGTSSSGQSVNLTTSTSSSGVYGFANVCAGTYTVCAGVPLGFQASPQNIGDDLFDSDGLAVGNNSCVEVTLGNSGTNNTIDFGFWKTPTASPGTGTPGYWKNHPEAWPVGSIVIGGRTYTKEEALYGMGLPDGDKTITMFRSLVSAKLNVLIGNESSCIASTIAAADAWLAQYPAGSQVKARTAAWKVGEPLYFELDAYNNGDRCAPHRE